jgi:hypothetical protein
MNKELERISNLLSIPKNRFLYLAISSALEEAQELLKQIDVSEYVREINEAVEDVEATEKYLRQYADKDAETA